MTTKDKVIETLGWYGALAVTGAYAFNSFGYLAADASGYQLLNLSGAIALAIITLYRRVYQSALVNVIWAIIAVVALAKLLT
jgi:hypothetical protein